MRYYTINIVAVLLLFISGCSSERILVSYGTTPIQPGTHLSIGGFIFDTGATYSTIFDDSGYGLDQKSASSEAVYDINRNRRKQDVYIIDSISFGNIIVKSGQYIHIPKSSLPVYMHSFKGLIGMNIINKANWFFDTKNNKVIVYPQDSLISVPRNSFYLSYHTTNSHPETSLKVEDIVLRNVRIDFGSFHTIDLNPADIAKINRLFTDKYIGSDTASSLSLFQDRTIHTLHRYSDLVINNSFIFEFPEIYENINGQDIRRIGFGFFRFFDYILINTKKKEIYLFN